MTADARAAPRRRRPGEPPLYEMVDSLIRRRRVETLRPPGAMIPSEMPLARELGVSQGAVRRALDALVAEGLLNRRQWLGAFVSEMRDRRSRFLFFNMIAENGRRETPAARLLARSAGPADDAGAERLSLAPGAPAARLDRLRLLRDAPAIVERVVAPEALLPGLGDRAPARDHRFRHYGTDDGVTVVRARERLRAVAASEADAAPPGAPPGSPLLGVDRVGFTIEGRPVERRLSRCDTRRRACRGGRGGAARRGGAAQS